MSEPGLIVELYGTRLGVLERNGAQVVLRWSEEAEHRWGVNSDAVSNTLRVGVESVEATEAFFGALLPEGNGLVQLARRLETRSDDLFGMFASIGADVVGAMTLGTEAPGGEPTPERDGHVTDLDAAEVLEPGDLAQMVANARGFVVAGGGSAVPGMQRKVALTLTEGGWVRGYRGLPSTHILKPVPNESIELALREQYALDLGRRLGLLSFESWIERIGDEHVLVIERYDREVHDGEIRRIHQEDFAQALTLPWGGNAKFEWEDRRANLAAIATVLDRGRSIFSTRESQRERLLRYVTFHVAIGNTDAHAKNFSILRPEHGEPKLAPLYDASSIVLAHGGSHRLAMYIDQEQWLLQVTAGHLVREGEKWGIPRSLATDIVQATLADLLVAVDEVEAEPGIAATVPGFVRGVTRNLARGDRAGHGLHGALDRHRRIDSSTFT